MFDIQLQHKSFCQKWDLNYDLPLWSSTAVTTKPSGQQVPDNGKQYQVGQRDIF